MAINPDLLIAAPMLQDSFVDKDGTPMAAGVITCYRDNSRTTLKNWYYQSSNFADSSGNYTFSALPNPLTLSAAGTICDINGVDTIPFFYPYDESDQTQPQPYYITIVNHDQTNQITRPNFPYNPNEVTPDQEGSVDNYIINNGFWRNAGTVNLNTVTQMIVCPSQHDGFRFPDIQFIKNNTSGQDTLTFTKFPLGSDPILVGDITPEYYINHTCSNSPSAETQKCYQFPISLHVNTLNAIAYTVTIQAQNIGGTATGENVIGLYILQDTGSGTSVPAPFLISNITVNTAWTKYEFTATFPNTAGLTLSGGANDALYLQVQMPLNINCSINFTRPSIYLTNIVPTNSFQTYDQVDSIISSPRTGDVRSSMNAFYPFGWVPMNNGTIGNASSNATSRANPDTFPLYNLLWNTFSNYNNSTTNLLAQLKNSAGTNVGYGASAIADFNANNQLTLSRSMGQVILGGAPPAALLTSYKTTFTATSNVFTTANNVSFFNGMPIYFTGTSGIATTAIYYVANFNGTNTFNIAASFSDAMSGLIITVVSDAGTIWSAYPGSYEGEYAHTQLIAELAAHHHTLSPAPQFPGAVFAGGAGYDAITANTSTTGSSTPFNVTQPGVFYNIFMKL